MLGADCEVSTVYVRPNAQGQGSVGALLRHALAHRAQGRLRAMACDQLREQSGHRVYLSQGFVKAGETVFRIGAEAYPNDIYLLKSG